MGCNCGGKPGTVRVWQWHAPDGVKVYASETEARIARERGGGRGPITSRSAPQPA